MSHQTEIAIAYMDAFASNDHAKILSLLTDDVVWEVFGHRVLNGKQEFESEIEGEGFEGGPRLEIDRVIDAGDTVIVLHHGLAQQTSGEEFRSASCDIFTFKGDLISRVESYVVPLTTPERPEAATDI